MEEELPSWEEVPGSSARVRHLDHTADVGLEIRAPSLDELLTGAVDGMMGLVRGEARAEEAQLRTVAVEGADPPRLLRNLLREVLYLHEAEGFASTSARIRAAEGPGGLTVKAELRGGPDPAPPHRELKGVTLHGLQAREGTDGEWFARVIFDV